MASVFLSYDREDVDRARAIALALENAGHFVWWDLHIKGGAEYGREIEQALEQSDAVVVLWSHQSVDSAWVRDEAAVGRDRGCLVPVRLDDANPPLGFRQYQTIDFSRWSGRGKPKQLQTVLEAVESIGDREAPPKKVKSVVPSVLRDRRPMPAFNWWLIAGVLILLLGLLIARPWEVQASVPVVGVRAANSTPDSTALARGLLVELGNVQSSRPDALQLVDVNAREKPDLILEVSGAKSASRSSANLTLLRGKDRQLLSSQSLEAGHGRGNDLEPSLAMSAARLIGCAAEAMQPGKGQLRLADLKLYVGACGGFAKLYGSDDIVILIPQFEQVVLREPGFVPAWRLLLLAGASLQAIPSDEPKPPRELLLNQIAAARRIDPAMPEVRIAEMELLPATDFEGRLRLIDSLAEREPENPIVLVTRSTQLMLVGRMKDAVDDAERAAMLDPMCAYCRHAYIQALAYSGRIPRAFQEIEKAAPLVLGAKNLIEADFRINMRYGDPRHALHLLRSYGTSRPHEVFLLARIEPTEPNAERAIAASLAESGDVGFFARHSEVLASFGRNDQIYAMLMQIPAARIEGGVIRTLFRPLLKDFRQDARFLQVAKRFGLAGYWLKTGKWPDYCNDPDLPYDCKAEAAKLS